VCYFIFNETKIHYENYIINEHYLLPLLSEPPDLPEEPDEPVLFDDPESERDGELFVLLPELPDERAGV